MNQSLLFPGQKIVTHVVFAVRATWMAYDYMAIQSNPDLPNAMQYLEDVFLVCKEQMEKKWQEVLLESGGEGKKKE